MPPCPLSHPCASTHLSELGLWVDEGPGPAHGRRAWRRAGWRRDVALGPVTPAAAHVRVAHSCTVSVEHSQAGAFTVGSALTLWRPSARTPQCSVVREQLRPEHTGQRGWSQRGCKDACSSETESLRAQAFGCGRRHACPISCCVQASASAHTKSLVSEVPARNRSGSLHHIACSEIHALAKAPDASLGWSCPTTGAHTMLLRCALAGRGVSQGGATKLSSAHLSSGAAWASRDPEG